MDNRVPENQRQASELQERLIVFLAPLLMALDKQLDARLVRTVVGTVAAIMCWRNRAHGLLLSELGTGRLCTLSNTGTRGHQTALQPVALTQVGGWGDRTLSLAAG